MIQRFWQRTVKGGQSIQKDTSSREDKEHLKPGIEDGSIWIVIRQAWCHTEAKLYDLNINFSHSHFCLKIRQIFVNDVIFKAAITYFCRQNRWQIDSGNFTHFYSNKSYSCPILINLHEKNGFRRGSLIYNLDFSYVLCDNNYRVI